MLRRATKEELILMLNKEEEIRNSQWYVDKCTEVSDEVNGWLRISGEVQYEVVKSFGFTSEMNADIAVNDMRRAQYLYPDEPKFKTISVYVRNNLANRGNMKPNDCVPNFILHDLKLQQIQLNHILQKNKINVLITSSHT